MTVPLVLLAGTVCDERLFAPVLERLALPEAHVIALDGAETTPDMARAVLDVAPNRFALVGFSLGGIVALEMIAQAPARIEALALIDTTARPDPAANAAVRRAAVERARAKGMPGYILDAWTRLVGPAHRDDAGLRDTLVAMAVDAGVGGLARHAEIAIHRHDSRPRLNRIEVPTLILAGEHDGICPPDAQRELAHGIAGARFHAIADAGHFAPLENPEEVGAHLVKWLEELAA